MKSDAQIAIEALDVVAHDLEMKWGISRLPAVVAAIDETLAKRFRDQLQKLNAAIETEQAAINRFDRERAEVEVERQAKRMMNAWMALDAAAEAAGGQKLDPRYMEARLPDGRLLVICADLASAHRMANDNRAAVVWSLDEVVRVAWGHDFLNSAKTLWPGARVEEVRVDPERLKPKISWSKGDELPDGLRALTAG